MSCPEYSPDDLKEWIETYDVPELAKTAHLEFVDIDSGHWPQVTQPEARGTHSRRSEALS